MKNSSVALAGIFDAIGRSVVRHCGHDPEAVALALETAFMQIMERHDLHAAPERDDLRIYAQRESLEAACAWSVRELLNVLAAVCAVASASEIEEERGATAREALRLLSEQWVPLMSQASAGSDGAVEPVGGAS